MCFNGVETTNQKANLFFLMQEKQVKKAAETEQARCTTPFALGKLSIMTDPLGSRILGTVFLGWFQCHGFRKNLCYYLFCYLLVLKQIVFPVQDSRLIDVN